MMFSLFTNKKQKELRNKREQLYRVAYSWCNDALLADDLTNEALHKALEKWTNLRDKSSINSWLFKILANCWYDHLRKIKPSESIDDIVLVDHETPEQLLQQQEIIIQVRKAISLLPMGQRQVITLVDLEGFSYEEVAAILNIPIGTVMSRLSRGRQSLKNNLLKKNRDAINNAPKITLRSVK
ncbi:MAG: RNA polymerase sigma factor [Gammaproteobacteria bacterium]|nr:RNA polymerase sigma factor [Gammaproteobacteria bacterium]